MATAGEDRCSVVDAAADNQTPSSPAASRIVRRAIWARRADGEDEGATRRHSCRQLRPRPAPALSRILHCAPDLTAQPPPDNLAPGPYRLLVATRSTSSGKAPTPSLGTQSILSSGIPAPRLWLHNNSSDRCRVTGTSGSNARLAMAVPSFPPLLHYPSRASAELVTARHHG